MKSQAPHSNLANPIPRPWSALVGAAALSCSGGGGNSGTPYSYNTGFGIPATATRPFTYVELVDITSGTVPKTCGDFAALADAGATARYDQSLQIAFYALDGCTFG